MLLFNDRIETLVQDKAGDPRLQAVDGGPGVGKTTHILSLLANRPEGRTAVVTYSKAAEAVVKQRLSAAKITGVDVGTVYALSWRSVSRYAKGKKRKQKGRAPWNERPARTVFDPMIDEYAAQGGRRIIDPSEESARKLHGWDGQGNAPFPLDRTQDIKGLKFSAPVGRWLVDGGEFENKYDLMIIDEAQDMSPLELAAALRMLKDDGVARAYLDPGQAVFANLKWGGSGLPPAWTRASTQLRLNGGWRVGEPLASLAAKVLGPVFERPAKVFARQDGKKTTFDSWRTTDTPERGLVLGFNRRNVARFAKNGHLGKTVPLTAGTGDPLKQVVQSTIHSAKGFEAPFVFLLPWPQARFEELLRGDQAMRQIAYVALTRATHEISIECTLYHALMAL